MNPPSNRTDPYTFHQADAWFVHLSEINPIAEGQESRVFNRPGKPSQIIKVSKSRQGRRLGFIRTVKSKLRHRIGILPDKRVLHKNIRRQYYAYLDAALRAESLRRPPPIAHVRGLLLTDIGLAMVVQKIRDTGGNPAPTVREILKENLIDAGQLQKLLTDFARDMRAFHIIGYDLTLANLLHETRHGRSRIILIDGYGSRSMIPIRRWSRWLNDKRLSQQFEIMAIRVGCIWDRNNWEFRCAGNLETDPSSS